MSKFKDFLTKERLPKGSKGYILTELLSGVLIFLISLAGFVYFIINFELKSLLMCLGGVILGLGVFIYYYRILNQSKKYLKNKQFKKAYDLFLVDYYNNKIKDKLRNLEVFESLDISKKMDSKEVVIKVKLDIFEIIVYIYRKRIELSIDYDIDFLDDFELVYEQTKEQEFSYEYFEEYVEIYQTIEYKNEDNINELYNKIAKYIFDRTEFLNNYESKFKKALDELNKQKL